MRIAAFIVVATAVAAGPVHASNEEPARAWHAGLNLSSDIGPHRVRVGAGAKLDRLTLSLVLDPHVMFDNKANDVDAVVEFHPWTDRWGGLVGWRTSSVSIDRGRHWHQHLLVGGSGRLPSLFGGRVRPSFGTQFVFTVVRHGTALETDWISFESDRHARDTLSMNLFVRFDYRSAF